MMRWVPGSRGRLFLVAALTAVLGATVNGAIRYSHHDFGGATWSDHEVCKPCHIPHDADLTVSAAPLWNHAVTSATYSVYTSPSLNSSPGTPGGVSKLCLSCHDGTIAIDQLSGQTGGSRYVKAYADIGTDLTNDHPISFVYDTALSQTDPGLRDPNSSSSGLGSTISQDLLFDGRMECSSCHDVHIDRNSQGCTGCHNAHNPTSRTRSLSLVKDNAASSLCLTCHDK